MWGLQYNATEVKPSVARELAPLHVTLGHGVVPDTRQLGGAHGAPLFIAADAQEEATAVVWIRELKLLASLPRQEAGPGSGAAAAELAPITAVCVDNSAGKVYSGDALGRVFSWTLPDVAGRSNDHWAVDSSVAACMECQSKFTFSERRHHCRHCGRVVCHRCSDYEAEIPALGIDRPVRVCAVCFQTLKSGGAGGRKPSSLGER
jgi:hypothetical protein